MKKNKLTFADKARRIQKKYARASFDPREAKEMEDEMNALMEEQEAARELMGMNDKKEFANGGYPEGDPIPDSLYNAYGFQPVSNPSIDALTGAIIGMQPKVNTTSNPAVPSTTTSGMGYLTPGVGNIRDNGMSYGNYNPRSSHPLVQPNTPTLLDEVTVTGKKSAGNNKINSIINNPSTQGIPQRVPDYSHPGSYSLADRISGINPNVKGQPYNTLAPMDTKSSKQISASQKEGKTKGAKGNNENLPYIASGLTNIGSNLLLAGLSGKNKPKISPTIVVPEKINMEPQAEQLRKEAGVSKNINMRNARNLGLNAGQTLANMGAVNAGVDRQLGNSLTGLYSAQEQYNANAANQTNQTNARSRERAKGFNAEMDFRTKQDQLGYLGAALATPAGVMKDIRMDKADKEMRDIQSAYVKNMGKNYATQGDIFSEGGITYKVKSVDSNGKITAYEKVNEVDKKYNKIKMAPKTKFKRQKFNTTI